MVIEDISFKSNATDLVSRGINSQSFLRWNNTGMDVCNSIKTILSYILIRYYVSKKSLTIVFQRK